MRHSNFSDETKHKIILEQLHEKLTVREICSKYKITPGTFYIWKRAFSKSNDSISYDSIDNERTSLEAIDENKTLRRLYINLSAHNYELAKFLEKH